MGLKRRVFRSGALGAQRNFRPDIPGRADDLAVFEHGKLF